MEKTEEYDAELIRIIEEYKKNKIINSEKDKIKKFLSELYKLTSVKDYLLYCWHLDKFQEIKKMFAKATELIPDEENEYPIFHIKYKIKDYNLIKVSSMHMIQKYVNEEFENFFETIDKYYPKEFLKFTVFHIESIIDSVNYLQKKGDSSHSIGVTDIIENEVINNNKTSNIIRKTCLPDIINKMTSQFSNNNNKYIYPYDIRYLFINNDDKKFLQKSFWSFIEKTKSFNILRKSYINKYFNIYVKNMEKHLIHEWHKTDEFKSDQYKDFIYLSMSNCQQYLQCKYFLYKHFDIIENHKITYLYQGDTSEKFRKMCLTPFKDLDFMDHKIFFYDESKDIYSLIFYQQITDEITNFNTLLKTL